MPDETLPPETEVKTEVITTAPKAVVAPPPVVEPAVKESEAAPAAATKKVVKKSTPAETPVALATPTPPPVKTIVAVDTNGMRRQFPDLTDTPENRDIAIAELAKSSIVVQSFV